MKSKIVISVSAAVVMAGMIFSGCENGSGDDGTLSILLTDAPFPADQVAEANITIDSLVVHVMESDTFITLSSDQQVFNLLDLRNGVTATLARLDIPTGQYNQLRLIVNNGGASVILNDGTSAPLKVPSGTTSGIKLNIKPFLQIEAGIESELLLDFDVSKSFLVSGSSQGSGQGDSLRFIFKPVIRAVNLADAGRLQGTVTDSSSDAGIAGAQVSISTVDSVLTTTFTDTTGVYAIIGIPADTYSVEATASGYIAKSDSVVAIDAKGMTVRNFALTQE